MEKELKLLPLLIQMFAEEDGDSAANDVNDVFTEDIDADDIDDVSDEDGTEDVTDTNDEQDYKPTKEPKKSTKDYSERLNADRAKIREELEKEQNERLDRIAKARGFDTWAELEEYSNKQQLEDLGVSDVEAFDKYLNTVIENNPEIVRARQIINEQRERENQRLVAEQIEEIGKLDPKIKSVNDLISLPNYDNILERVKKGATILDAYKLENFDTLTGRNADAAVQHAYNNVVNKTHMKTATGSVPTDIVVPNDIYAMYKKNMPNWTDEQIKKHYAKETGGEV